MPQYDLYHHEVKNALSKDGWLITDDPYTLEYKGLRLYADLGAEKLLAAEKEERKIAIEIKVFNSISQITELQKAIGQYNMYQSILNRVSPERKLFLAISEEVYNDFFQKPAIQDIINDQKMYLMIFDPEQEVICQWLN
ncbi:element excision factor XisH family protein [Roseofilum capinflatum]|uniref:Element excision factor XisH family protein n=1 Tax=Roseofilum capinflatum BLCC-M114 TaxID=3022440 RepID=A0ABT7BAA3_9CYAN|nr:element excision factor XisH family protein [Roseofilum capinflatum]MDJ1176099.1 element excision factor XisH family protein [Roseofilum capinflatum BLCC-M114]